ncbi:glycogen synthase GlgA [Opitutaceae bacterium TAV4]|nr:glycogen synthase GlgA [Opitutaceae bacterium TAV4]RRK01108.1 glycogen synthase GlgA [Opitutaceae bacterium TAV3]
MKIVHVASELFPYVKTGGLADAAGALTSTLADRGHEVAVFLPGYRAILDHPDAALAAPLTKLRIEMGDEFMSGDLRCFRPKHNLTIYLVCREEFFDRRNPYGNGARDYEDNDQRFVFFCKGVVESLRLLEYQADLVHCHDWQTGILPLLLRHTEERYQVSLALRTVFTIHNIAFQGVFPMKSFIRTNLPSELQGIDGIEFYGQISLMKAGILFSDRVTTVSPRYALEIQTPEFGAGLDGVIKTRADDLVGILNGIDTTIWNPATDPSLPANYTATDLAGKTRCRRELLVRHGMDPDYPGPVIGMVCRLTTQKGVDLVLDNHLFFQRSDCRLIVLGTGDKTLERGLRELTVLAPRKVALSAVHDEAMSHLIEAGSDFFLMPSKFEPCGLNQMYSQAYGTIPLVSSVGGLIDTVIDVDGHPAEGTGILFPPTANGLRHGLERALLLYSDTPRHRRAQQRAMARDFGWACSVAEYERIYEEMC